MITRTITVYLNKFGVYNPDTGRMNDIVTTLSTKKLGPRMLSKAAADLGERYVYLTTEELTKTYTLPIEEFIEAANKYAEEAAK